MRKYLGVDPYLSEPKNIGLSIAAPYLVLQPCISMSAKRAVCLAIAVALLGVLLFTRVVGNGLMLIMERENFVPAEASIFTLDPYVINEGSSSYWLYAEDNDNYYHFTYEPGREYLLMSKDQPCPGFQRDDFSTWCTPKAKSKLGSK